MMKHFFVIISSILLFPLLSLAQEIDLSKVPVVVKDGKEYYVYKVEKSEGFYRISKKFNVTIKEIVDANPIGDGLKVGQDLYIPTGRTVSADKSDKKPESAGMSGNAAQYKIHTVQKKETLYSISKMYGVTVEEIRELNPDSQILSIGQELKIPVKGASSETKPAVTETKPVVTETKPAVTETSEPVKEDEVVENTVEEVVDIVPEVEKIAKSAVNIAILMPFNVEQPSANDEKFIDFYRGCLLAADSLSNAGLRVSISAYDIGKTKESLQHALKSYGLDKADIIIGPAYSAQIEYVADFAKAHNIKTVIPFANNIPQIKDNRLLFQVVTPQQLLFEDVAAKCAEAWQGKKVLIAQPDSAGIRFNKKEFSDLLMDKLQARGVYHKYISNDKIAGEVNRFTLADTSEVVVVIPTTNNVRLVQISDHLTQIKSPKVSIFGFPEWNDMLHKELYVKPLYMFTNYWLDFTDSRIIEFYNKYYNKFGVPDSQNNPSYSIFGFDITLYFGKALQHSGNDFEYFLQDEDNEMLQMVFDFKKEGNGGYINKGFYLQLYNETITNIK